MKNLIILLAIASFVACKKKADPVPVKQLSITTISSKDTAYSVDINYNLASTGNSFISHEKVFKYIKSVPIGSYQTITFYTGDSTSKTIILVSGNDTLSNQTSTSDPFTVSVTIH